MYPNYLIHFNKNHSSSTGQFISGDGDGDGVVNDHKNQKSDSSSNRGWKNDAYKTGERIRNTGKKALKSGITKLAIADGLTFVSAVSSVVSKQTDSTIASGIAAVTAAAAVPLTAVGTTQVVTGAINTGRGNARMRNAQANK